MKIVLIVLAVPLVIIGAIVVAALAYALWWLFFKRWPRGQYR